MRITRSVFFLTLVATSASALLLVDVWLTLRDARYTNLVEKYECGYVNKLCEADFNGDGRAGHILINSRPNLRAELPPEMIDGEQELFRLNAFSLDNTLRTHVAVRSETGGARLLIWEGVQTERTPRLPVSVVYAWDRGKLSEVEASVVDKEILMAMAARDDAGTWNEWVVYYLLVWPVRVVYGLLSILAAVLYRGYRRSERPLP